MSNNDYYPNYCGFFEIVGRSVQGHLKFEKSFLLPGSLCQGVSSARFVDVPEVYFCS